MVSFVFDLGALQGRCSNKAALARSRFVFVFVFVVVVVVAA